MRPATRQRIEAELTQIEAQIKQIESEGDYLLQAWVGDSQPSGKRKAYPRVQSRLPQFGGKKVRHIRIGESIAAFEAMCDRGQQIGKLSKRREALLKTLESPQSSG
jgi:hypothetical protein